MTDTGRIFVLITVTLVEGAVTHPEDAREDGADAIVGTYNFDFDPDYAQARGVDEGEDPAIETALDQFHETIGIKVLDNYSIVAKRIASADEAPENTSWR